MLTTYSLPNKILITADFLRPKKNAKESATAANSKWLKHSIETPLKDVTNLKINEINWGIGFDTEKFYHVQGIELNLDGWAKMHYKENLEPKAEQMLQDAFNETLVISCELPMCVIRALTRLKIPVIDTVGYPLRFLEDHLNAWRTNHQLIAAKIKKYKFDLQYAHYQAGLIRSKTVWMGEIDTPHRTAILMGQVSDDKSLIDKKNGRILSFSDFNEKIEAMIENHPRVIYKPHPYAEVESYINLLKSNHKIQITNANYYWLISQDNISDVYSISSGTCSEAPYFGKNGIFLYEPLYDINEENHYSNEVISSPIPVAQDWLWPEFWRDILSPITETKTKCIKSLPFRANRIRRTLNADWGFGAIDKVTAAIYK
jgi:hypothetical protein